MKMAKEQCLKPKRVLIMASGNGSNFEAIVKYFSARRFAGKVKFELLCDKKDAPVLERAKRLCIPAFYLKFGEFSRFLVENKYDLYVLAGFMRILPDKILKIIANSAVSPNIINIHPSLLPKFKGKNAIQRAHEAKVKKTGVTVHFVNNKLDGGKIIEQREIEANGLSLNALESQIHVIEHTLYPDIIEKLLFKKNVLIYGGGAREQAIAEKIAASPFLNKLYLANSNAGFKNLGETIDFLGYFDLLKKSLDKNIDIFIVGPENPLIDGIADIFKKSGIFVIGPNKDWARLEGSKVFAKEFMKKNSIETGAFVPVTTAGSIKAAFETFKNQAIPVIKADGPALGKGVELPKTLAEAEKSAKAFLDGKFGDASKKILIEERLFGKEISIMSLWDGVSLLSFPPASDYKRLMDNDMGPNTGGMGAIAPSKITKKEACQIKEYLKKLETALKKEKADFTGIVYSGLILTDCGVRVLEYNMRFGDPECQALLELLKNDLLFVFLKMAEKRLCDIDLRFKQTCSYCLTLASKGYPDNPKKGAEIKNLNVAKKTGCKIYFAGVKALSKCVKVENETLKTSKSQMPQLFTNGGRVLSIVKSGKNALKSIYKAADTIVYDGKIFRKDIGK